MIRYFITYFFDCTAGVLLCYGILKLAEKALLKYNFDV